MVSHCPFEFELLSLILKPFIIHANQSIQLSHQSPHTARLNSSHIRHHSLHTHFPACCCHQPGCCFRNAPPHGQLCSHLTVSSAPLSWVLSSEIPWQSLPGSGSQSITLFQRLWSCARWTVSSLRFCFPFSWFSFIYPVFLL